MRGDEINGNMLLRSMSQEIVDPICCSRGRTSHSQMLIHRLDRTCRVVVQLEVAFLPGNTVPEIDVRFVPDFEVPLRYFCSAITFHQVPGERGDQPVPPVKTLRWRDILLVPERMKRIRVKGQLLRHKADLDHRTNAVLQKSVVDLIYVGEVVDRCSVFIFVINADFIMQDAVETNVAEVCDLFHRPQVIPVTLAEGKNGTA